LEGKLIHSSDIARRRLPLLTGHPHKSIAICKGFNIFGKFEHHGFSWSLER
jgi:hypothetical protein